MKTIRPSTREAIVEAAFRLYKDTPTASLADIAKTAGIGRATLHRHFKSRDDLLIELAKVAINELDSIAESAASQASSYTDALKRIMQAIIPLADRQWFLSREAVEHNPLIIKTYERQRHDMQVLINQAKAEDSFDETIPTFWIAQVFDSLIVAAWEAVRNDEVTVKQATDLAWHTFIKGTGALDE